MAGASPNLAEIAVAAAAIISAFTAAIAIRIQSNNATRQIRATVVSVNRQAWINGLRDDVAEVLALVDGFDRHMRSIMPTRETSQAVQEQRFEYEHRANLALNRIRLRLNESEPDAVDLVGFLQSAVADMRVDGRVREGIVNTAQRILKAEWARVKRLE